MASRKDDNLKSKVSKIADDLDAIARSLTTMIRVRAEEFTSEARAFAAKAPDLAAERLGELRRTMDQRAEEAKREMDSRSRQTRKAFDQAVATGKQMIDDARDAAAAHLATGRTAQRKPDAAAPRKAARKPAAGAGSARGASASAKKTAARPRATAKKTPK